MKSFLKTFLYAQSIRVNAFYQHTINTKKITYANASTSSIFFKNKKNIMVKKQSFFSFFNNGKKAVSFFF